MGLDLSCGVSFSYGGFAKFRRMIAKEVGINLDEMEGFGGERSWKEIKDDIKYFLNHSDCDGQISAKRCGQIAARLREITKEWIENEDSYDDTSYYKRKALDLSEGMEDCCNGGYPLKFE